MGLAVAYAASGKLALLLAVPPGYASPIFPPSGIAVAAMLIGRRATLPWTFLGSLLLNLCTVYSPDNGSLAVALVIAAASMLQAAVGGAVLRRAIRYPAPLGNGRDIMRLLFLSPVFCLTSATLSLAGLSMLGVVELPALLLNWFSWWIGDALGVLVGLPLILVLAGEPRDLWRSRTGPVAFPMVLSFALFVAIFVRVDRWEHNQHMLEFRLLSQEIVQQIRSELEEQRVFLEQLERSFSGPGSLSPVNFQHLVQNLLEHFPLIQAVEWAPRVASAMRGRFEAAQQARLLHFEIREADASAYPRRASDRPQYYPITYIEPLSGNEQAEGFDLASEPSRKAAVEAAITSGGIAATAPVRLVQDTAEQTGILLIFPVRDGSSGPGVLLVSWARCCCSEPAIRGA